MSTQGRRKQFFVGGQGSKELDCAKSTPTSPNTGHLSRHRHSLGIFLVCPFVGFTIIINYFLLIVPSICKAAAHREIFDINSLRGKLQQLGLPNLQDIFIGR